MLDTQHTFFKELQQSSPWVNKNIRQHKSLRMEECTPKLSSDIQCHLTLQRGHPSALGWPMAYCGRRGWSSTLFSPTHTPRALQFSVVFTSVHMNRGKLFCFSLSLSQRKGYQPGCVPRVISEAGQEWAYWQAFQLLDLRPCPAIKMPWIPSLLHILSSSLQSHVWVI